MGILCLLVCLGVCEHPMCPGRQEIQPGKVRKTRGLAGVLPVDSGAPEPGPLQQGPGDSPVWLWGWGGAAHSLQAGTCPVAAASPLYYLAYPQRKSLQIPSFLPAAVRPPPGSGAKEWNVTLPPLPPLGMGLGGGRWGATTWRGAGASWGFAGG